METTAAPQQQHRTAPSQYIPLASITPSKTNPRRVFDQAKLADLAASIKEHGVLEPILVRHLPGSRVTDAKFEIVAGERRFRAATIANLPEVPAIVRTLNDEQTLEIQVIENVQRDDLHPLEEAQGYGDLVKLFKHSVDDIAAKVGKSAAYVAARMKLLELAPAVQNMFRDGAITPSIALIIARIPVKALHAQAAKEIVNGRWRNSECMSTAGAREHVQQNYMLDLKEARFDAKDATLNAPAGACGDCPKRTGNQAALFSDITRGDLCTDPACFRAKSQEYGARLLDVGRKNGQKVIEGAAAKKVMPHAYRDAPEGMLRLDSKQWIGDKYQSVSAIIGKEFKPILIANPHKPGEVIEAAPVEAFNAALKAKGISKGMGRSSSTPAARAAAAAQKLEAKTRWRVFMETRARVPAKVEDLEDLRMIVSVVWTRTYGDNRRIIAPLWVPDPEGKSAKKMTAWDRMHKVDALIEMMDAAELTRLLFDAVLSGQANSKPYRGDRDDLLALAKRVGVDAAAIAREEKAAAAKKKPAAKKAPTKKTDRDRGASTAQIIKARKEKSDRAALKKTKATAKTEGLAAPRPGKRVPAAGDLSTS